MISSLSPPIPEPPLKMNSLETLMDRTVVMRLAQFEQDYLHSLTSGFASAVSDEFIRSVWWCFNVEFNKGSDITVGQENQPRKYACTWVCG